MFTEQWLIHAMRGDQIIVRHITRPALGGVETICLAIGYWTEDIASHGFVIQYRHQQTRGSGIQPLTHHVLSGNQNQWYSEVQRFIGMGPRYWQEQEKVVCALPDRSIPPGHLVPYGHLARFQAATALYNMEPRNWNVSMSIVANRLEGLLHDTTRAVRRATETTNC